MGVTFFKSNLLTAEDVAYPLTERALFAMVYDIYATSCVFSIKKHTSSIKSYTIANPARFFLSHVLPSILLNLSLFCKKNDCEPHNTFLRDFTHKKNSA